MHKSKLLPGFAVLFLVLLFLFAAYSMIQGLLVLYATKALGLSDNSAYLLYAAFGSILFAFPVYSGFLAQRFLGYPLALVLGITLATVGLYIICFSPVTYFYVGLSFFCIGKSSALASIFVLLGRLFKKSDLRRESGFTLAYAAINIGSLLTLTASGFIVQYWGFQLAFLISAVFMLIALITFILGMRTFLHPDIEMAPYANTSATLSQPLIGIAGIILAIPVVAEFLYYAESSTKILLLLSISAFCFIIYLTRHIKMVESKKLYTYLFIIAISTVFWAIYMLAPSALLLFILRNVDRHFFSYVIPASDFYALNPLFIIVLSGLLSALWLFLQKQRKAPSLFSKFAIGLACMAVAYGVLALGTHFTNSLGLISIAWVIVSYFFQAAGELCISPIGAAKVGELVHEKYEGIFMGIWFLSIGFGGSLSGYLAVMTISPQHILVPLTTNHTYAHSFSLFSSLVLSAAIIAGIFAYRHRIHHHVSAK